MEDRQLSFFKCLCCLVFHLGSKSVSRSPGRNHSHPSNTPGLQMGNCSGLPAGSWRRGGQNAGSFHCSGFGPKNFCRKLRVGGGERESVQHVCLFMKSAFFWDYVGRADSVGEAITAQAWLEAGRRVTQELEHGTGIGITTCHRLTGHLQPP